MEKFSINNMELEFSDNSKIWFENGKMNVDIQSIPFKYDEKKHKNIFSDYPLDVKAGFRIRNIIFPTDKVRRIFKHPEENQGLSIWEDGFVFGIDFFGTISIKDELFCMDGMLKHNWEDDSQGAKILLCKKFTNGEVSNKEYTFGLEEAKQTEFKYVKNLFINLQDFEGELPVEVFNFYKLEYLSISYFTGKKLPDLFDKLSNLETLVIQEASNLQYLPKSISKLTNLESLYLSNINLQELPSQITQLKNLKKLDIYRGNLEPLNKDLFLLPLLEDLRLGYVGLISLPDNLSQAKSLKKINLLGNKFTSLPKELANFEVVEIEREYKPFFMDISYQSKNKKPIDETIFKVEYDKRLKQELTSYIKEFELENYKNELFSTSLKSLAFTTTQEENYKTKGNTRFGGAPDLPQSIDYPTTNGEYWIFLAQINLSDIAHLQNYMPRKGILYFFVEDLDSIENIKVIHYDGNEELKIFIYEEGICFYDEFMENKPYLGFTAKSQLQNTLPFLYNDEDILTNSNKKLLQLDRSDNYNKLIEKLNSNKDGMHFINAYVFTQNESIWEQAANKKGGNTLEWMTLLSLKYDYNTGFEFWDAGTLTFVIHKKDLAIGNFSNVYAMIESS
jgi:uncharacterized protein YwqG